MAIALLPLELEHRGFSKGEMGTLAAVFALGIVALSIPMGAIVKKVTPQRTLLVALVGYAVTVGVFPVLHHVVPVGASRFADGAFSVGIWVSCETILLERADKAHRAFVTSLYAMSMAIGYIAGPLVARVIIARFPSAWAFYAASGMSIAAALVASRIAPSTGVSPEEDATADSGAPASHRAADPREDQDLVFRDVRLRLLPGRGGAFFAHLPHPRQGRAREEHDPRHGLLRARHAAVLQLRGPARGSLRGHLLVMRVLAVIGACMIASFVYLPSFPLMCAAVFVAGASLASISPVSLALQGVVTPDRELGRANGIYNAFYAIGMFVGPLVSSQIFDARGGAAMLFHFVALWLLFVVFAWIFAKDDPRRGDVGFRAAKSASV